MSGIVLSPGDYHSGGRDGWTWDIDWLCWGSGHLSKCGQSYLRPNRLTCSVDCSYSEIVRSRGRESSDSKCIDVAILVSDNTTVNGSFPNVVRIPLFDFVFKTLYLVPLQNNYSVVLISIAQTNWRSWHGEHSNLIRSNRITSFSVICCQRETELSVTIETTNDSCVNLTQIVRLHSNFILKVVDHVWMTRNTSPVESNRNVTIRKARR